MKITTWNVNGIRAWLKKGSWDWISHYQPDVLGIQEIKAKPEQLTQKQHAAFEPYSAHWHAAERPGYSGTATFVKGLGGTSVFGLGDEQFDVEGRLLQTHLNNLVIMNGYFPNGSRDHVRVPYKLEFYAKLLALSNTYHQQGKQLIITGDFNTCHQEIDLKNHKTNHNNTGFLPEEREWVTRYLENGFVDAFRALYPDKEQYTWWHQITNARARNVGWRLDYFLVSESLMPRVADVIIHDEVLGSDHCPVTLILND
jgi:exodeoxyribonuclease-3